MFFTVAKFLFSPAGRIVLIVGAIMMVILAAWGMLKIHDAGIRREALLAFNKQQVELVLKEQEENRRKTAILLENQEKLIKKIEDITDQTNKTVEGVRDYLTSDEARKADRPASDVLKETLRRMGAPK